MLDTSGSMISMDGAQKWVLAHSVALHIAEQSLQNTSLSLVLFSDKINSTVDFSQGTSEVRDRLLEIGKDPSFVKNNIRGATTLLDTIFSVSQSLGDPRYSDSIYVISDGEDNKSLRHLQDIRNVLVSRGIRLSSMIVPNEHTRTPEETYGPEEIVDLARVSGGLVFGPPSGSGYGRQDFRSLEVLSRWFGTALSAVYLEMTQNDLMDIKLPLPPDKWSTWSLKFSPEKKPSVKGWAITYPQMMAPCSALPQ